MSRLYAPLALRRLIGSPVVSYPKDSPPPSWHYAGKHPLTYSEGIRAVKFREEIIQSLTTQQTYPMKTLFLLLAPMLAIITRQRMSWLDALDFSSVRYEITWDDITEDLWP